MKESIAKIATFVIVCVQNEPIIIFFAHETQTKKKKKNDEPEKNYYDY